MSYRDHDYTTPTGTHPVGDRRTTGGSAWGLGVVLVILLGLLGLAMMAGPSEQRGDGMNTAPLTEETAPVPNSTAPNATAPGATAPVDGTAPAPAQPVD